MGKTSNRSDFWNRRKRRERRHKRLRESWPYLGNDHSPKNVAPSDAGKAGGAPRRTSRPRRSGKRSERRGATRGARSGKCGDGCSPVPVDQLVGAVIDEFGAVARKNAAPVRKFAALVREFAAVNPENAAAREKLAEVRSRRGPSLRKGRDRRAKGGGASAGREGRRSRAETWKSTASGKKGRTPCVLPQPLCRRSVSSVAHALVGERVNFPG
jgi:hypothetical protein